MMIKASMEVKTAIQGEIRKILYFSVGDMDDGREFDRIVLHKPKRYTERW